MSEGRFLGKQTEYKATYDKSLLNPVPRIENRVQIGLTGKLPFLGYDIWNAYEVSCLSQSGVPVVGIAKIRYPVDSEFLIESKSLKLYLFSFNMERIGGRDDPPEDIREKLQRIIQKDLSEVLKTNVRVQIFPPTVEIGYFSNIAKDLDQLIDYSNFHTNEYNENVNLLQLVEPPSSSGFHTIPTYFYKSNLLRSNCKITKQPDWGTVYINFSGERTVDPTSLLRYIISFRNENHFHEEICETIFMRLHTLLRPFSLCVACFYTRRGGIDINPIRSTHSFLIRDLYDSYIDMQKPCQKHARQ